MAYRAAVLDVTVADDSNLTQVEFKRKATIYQTKDLETVTGTIRVGPSDAQAALSFGNVAQGKFVCIMSDYPIRVRIEGSSATQFTMNSSVTAVTNVGAPAPDQCFFCANIDLTTIHVQPITSATQTANVRYVVSGDPSNAYT